MPKINALAGRPVIPNYLLFKIRFPGYYSFQGGNTPVARWLSLWDICMDLCLGKRAVLALLKQGQLVGIRLPKRGRSRWGEWRILDPSEQFARYIQESKRHVEHVQLLSSREVAEALGVKPGNIRQLKKRGRIQGKKVGNTTLYPAAEVRRFVFNKKRGNQRNGRQMYSPILANWLQGFLEKNDYIEAQVFAELLEQVVPIPAPDKSGYITELWHHFDAINDLLLSARRGEGFFSAVKKLDRHKQYFQPIADRDLTQCFKPARRA